MNLSRIIALRDRLYRKWRGAPGKTVKAKNPRRVEGGKKAARTRALRKAEARMVELYGSAADHPDAWQVKP